MTQLFIHIGPFKTGTTSFQDHMWANRDALLKQGVLYPKTGVHIKGFGKRHLELARAPRKKPEQKKIASNYKALRKEIASHPEAKKTVLSAERFSHRMRALVMRKRYYADYDPKLVVVIRDEVAMARSMYFQLVQERFLFKRDTGTDDIKDFGIWFEAFKMKMSYPIMLDTWVKNFGPDSVLFVPYEVKNPGFNVITSLFDVMGLPHMEIDAQKGFRNPSIGTLAAASAIFAADYGRTEAKQALKFATMLETEFPEFKKMPPRGFDPDAIRAYYDEQNAPFFETVPQFKIAHDIATGKTEPAPQKAKPASLSVA